MRYLKRINQKDNADKDILEGFSKTLLTRINTVPAKEQSEELVLKIVEILEKMAPYTHTLIANIS